MPPAVYLDQGAAPGSEGMLDIPKQVRPGDDRVVTQVHRPLLYPYLPAEGTETGMAVIIAPGGGHNSLWSTHEAHSPAKYFAERGIASFVLEYRLAEEKDSKYSVDEHALGDMQRALRLVRARAKDWKIDPTRVGVMGFSAGGELAALSGMRFDACAHAKKYHVDPDRIGAYRHSAGAHLALMLAMTPDSAGLEGDGGWDD